MLNELSELTELFMHLDEEAKKFLEPKLNNFGVTNEIIQKSMDSIIAGKPMEPFIEQRRFNKQEIIIHAWEFKLPDGTMPLIFETGDGCLWQLCDVGLGWTRYDKIGSEWKLNEKIQKFLPAVINPRPKGFKPWNYEFNLLSSAIFWVKKGSREKTFKWGIKTKSKKN